MKPTAILLLCLLGFALSYPIHEAENVRDINAFRERHFQDTSVLYFEDTTVEEKGFWSSLFSLFGSSSKADETYLNDIAENAPVLKVDLARDDFSNISEKFALKSLPFVFVFHHGEELLKEFPTSSTADKIEDLILEKEEASLHKANATAHTKVVVGNTTGVPTIVKADKNQPKPVTIVHDFGHLSGKEEGWFLL